MAGAGRYPRSLTASPSTTGQTTRVRTMAGADGKTIRYLGRRLLPAADSIVSQGVYVVQPGDRIDLVADRLLGDPLQYWRLADANDRADPLELCATPGRRITVPALLGDLAHDPFGQPPVPGASAAAPVTDEQDADTGADPQGSQG